MLRALNQRSNTEPIWVRAEGINPWLIVSFLASALLIACILWIPALRSAFGLALPNAIQWLWIFTLSFLSIVQVEMVKLAKRLFSKLRHTHA